MITFGRITFFARPISHKQLTFNTEKYREITCEKPRKSKGLTCMPFV